ncbi:NAD(P)-binding protein [Schizophyllum commune H4-8]|uniref:Thioester reductase (TE) domain-containing protein n=1 Tax=Schizophyllum commune (strain H4-8 / FGSC 9210) TaxID=578458 RepID=D8QLB3_SCHCM|nr:NAD(P)-binding protein [Schizophyllum commune H4-8]KAI5884830.1 NAD(P)-binding protein [Schizophyllum commune H4-8]
MKHSTQTAEDAVIAMAAKYSEGLRGYIDSSTLPRYVPPAIQSPLALPVAVLLTGSTGNLGTYLLLELLGDPRVNRVYTLDRAGKAAVIERQLASFADKGLDPIILASSKLVVLEGDAYAENLGQTKEVYADLLDEVSVIIHAAWRLNWNAGLDAFEPNVRATRALVDFARMARHADGIRFLFTSSIGSAHSWDAAARGPVPEELIEDPAVCIGGNGYGQSKYVAERVLAASGITFSSVRIGQASGGMPRGAWATSAWFPTLVKLSLHLGALPSDEQPVAWLPMDVVAKITVDLVFSKMPLPPSLGIAHPRPIPWSQMINYVQLSLKRVTHRNLRIISFHEWMIRLEAAALQSSVDARDSRDTNLFWFFRQVCTGEAFLRRFATANAESLSETLRNTRTLKQRDADAWVDYWAQRGLFKAKNSRTNL